MKKRISLVLCVLIMAASVARPQTFDTTRWTLYTVKGERFSIALPALPVLQTSKETRMPPQKDRRRRVIKCSMKGVNYSVQIVENPKPRLTLDSFIQEQAAADPSEKLISARDFNVDGGAAKEFVYPDGKGKVQFLATEDRLYEVRAYGAPVNDLRINTFFHYLALKQQKNAIEISEKVQAGALETDTENTFTGGQVDTKIRLIRKPEPDYSDEARGRAITGTVILKCVFAANGTVTNILVVQSLPYGLTERAIEAARKIKFVPATKDGKNVSMWLQLEYNFNLY